MLRYPRIFGVTCHLRTKLNRVFDILVEGVRCVCCRWRWQAGRYGRWRWCHIWLAVTLHRLNGRSPHTVVWVGLQGVLVCVRLCCRRRCTGWGHGAVLFRYRAQRRFHAPVVSRGKGDMRTSPAGNLAIRGTLLVHARRWCCAVVVSIMVPHALLGRVVRTSRLVILALGTS